jgi:hypothetical protein
MALRVYEEGSASRKFGTEVVNAAHVLLPPAV